MKLIKIIERCQVHYYFIDTACQIHWLLYWLLTQWLGSIGHSYYSRLLEILSSFNINDRFCFFFYFTGWSCSVPFADISSSIEFLENRVFQQFNSGFSSLFLLTPQWFSFLKIITLLSYNPHTLKFTLLNYVIQCLLCVYKIVQPSLANFKAFSSASKQIMFLLVVIAHYSFHSNPWQLLIYFLFLCICLFWTL